MPNCRPLLPCSLRKMPPNPNSDLFDFKKVPGNPNFGLLHQVKVLPKWGKSTERKQNFTKTISSEDGQDTSECQILGHFWSAWSRKWPETPIVLISLSKNRIKMRKIKPWLRSTHFCRRPGYIITQNFRSILHLFPRKCPETPNCCHSDANQQTVTQILSFLKVLMIHPQAIPRMRYQKKDFWLTWSWNLAYPLEKEQQTWNVY